MDTEDMDVVHALANDDAESSNPQTDQNSTDALTYQDNYEAASIELTIEPEQDKEDEGQSERQEDERQEDEMAEITKTSKKQKSCEMDKFKRRLIRAIARLMRDEQAPSEELWAELKKQSGCDCKLLWDRMCTLTKKKLGKLFTAEDKIADINPIAQLTVTDWLLFDLVLVHEKIDVLGQDREDADAEESPKILEDLFAIVVVFDLERLEGDALTKAWFEATAHYNGTQRQCSPMLLQRRWYQLKQAVREKFYQFWYMYRGTQRYLQAAIEVKPTTLQMEIVKLYKYITTQPFPTWEELIKQKKVALPEDFERLQLAKRRIFRTETGPDLEVIEPHVETIDLDQPSDSEESRDSCSTQDPKDNVDLGVVKTEKVDEISDDEDDVRILESVQIPLETDTNAEDGIILRNSIEQNVEEHGSADIDNEDISIVDDDHGSINFTQSDSVAAGTNEITDLNTQNIDTADFQDDTGYIDGSQNDAEMVMPTIVASASIANISQEFDIPMPIITNVSSAAINTDEPVDDAVNSEIDGILQSVVENISTKNLFDVPQRTDKTLPTPDNMQDPDTLVENIIDEENLRTKNIEVKGENCMDSFNTAPNDFNIFDGIILEDDGIEYIEEEDHMKEINIKAEIETEDTHDQDCVSTPTIDLKLLLTPVVYTKKLDDMDVFRFIDYNAVKDKRVLENADSESKPVDKNSVKMEEISQERPSTPDSDAFSDSMSEYHSEVDSGSESINPSSWLLSKPRNVSYNPIQLCKNPDFNTRLKRLSAGFFSLERNRRLLKECKPLTIDLHKSFESKLVNNTLYLSGTKPTETKKDGLNENAIGTTVRPTNLPIQNLVDNITNDILGATPPSPQENQCAAHQATQDSHLAERNKVINLPDIAQIRRLNERLLTAEVTPIQVSHSIKAPVSIVSAKHNLGTASENNRILQKNKDIICEGTELPMLPTVSDLDSGASSSLNKISLTTTEDKCDNLANITHKMKSLESINRSCNVSRGNFFNRFNNNQQQKTGPKKPMRANRVEVSWNPRENPNKMIIPQDRLLTSDTVDKILNVCNGNDAWFKNSKAYKKALRKKSLKAQKQKERKEALNEEIIDSEVKNNETTEVSIDNEVSFVSEEAPIENVPDNIIAIQTTNEINKVSQDKIMKRIEREKLSKHAIGRVKYCCWAREKVIKLGSGKRPIQKHKCPQPLCTCCCRQDLVDKMFEMNKNRDQLKRSQMSKRETNLSKPIIINVTSQRRLYKNSKEIPHKVSVGINTDFDPDFETTFAANLAEHKTSSKLVDTEKPAVSSIKVTIEPNMCSQANGQTQTSMNLIVLNENNKNKTFGITNAPNIITESDSFSFNEINSYIRKTTNVTPVKIGTVSQTNDSITLKDSNTFNLNPTLKPIVLNKNNLKFSVTSSNILQKNLTVVSNQNSPISSSKEFSKTRSVIVPKKRMSQRLDLTPPFGGDPKVALGEKSEKLDKVLFLSNDKWKTTTNQTPICLGKNKILLCSFEKPHMKNLIKPDDNNANQSQICSQNISPVVALPDGVRIVLLPNQELALSIDPGVELDSIQLEYLPSIMASIQQQLATADDVGKIATFGKDELKNKGDSNDLNNINLEKRNESEIKSDKKLIDNDTLVNATSLDCNEQSIVTSDTIIDITKERDTDNKEKNSNDKDENIHCQLDNSNICEVNLKDDSDLNKKTILSDLMEMSGISAEDTHLTSPTKQPELHPIPVIQRLHSRITEHNEKYINNPLFNNPVVKTALNRCPELCIVFSYTELRYASENNAQFFKMDIETGVVVPINLVIKKQLLDRKSNKPLLSSKSVIDLTDDPDEDETISIEEQNRQTGEVESTTEKQKDRVVPVKLYSAIHPSIIRQKLKAKSLLMQALKSNTKPITNVKKIRIIQVKRKRKQSLECVESIDLDSDTEQKESTSADVNLEVTPEKRKSVDDSDSDDEPLAFKAKRMKEPTEPPEPTESINVITDDQEEKLEDNTNHNTEMVTDEGSEATETVNENLTTEDTPQNKPDEPFVNPRPHLEPVVFEPLDFDENMAESSDDDCILGV